MVKQIGILLILSGLFALTMAVIIDSQYATAPQISGNVTSDLIKQPPVKIGFVDYVEAIAFSYSIISFIMGFVFLVRVK